MSLVAIAGQTFRLRVELESQSAAGTFQSSPTVAAGDVKLLILPASPAGTETYANSTNAPTLLNGPTAEVIIAAAETTAAGDGGERRPSDLISSDFERQRHKDISRHGQQ